MHIQSLHLYPIKSLGGIAVSEAVVDEKGFRHDRRFMLVTPSGDFITQRANGNMALIDVTIIGETLRVWHRHAPDDALMVPLNPEPETLIPIPVSIWDSDNVGAVAVSDEADAWFSRVLAQPCRLVFMPYRTRRAITSSYVRADTPEAHPIVSFADGFPYLIVSQESLDELNRRLPEPIEMARFRPNIVVSGVTGPHDEDAWAEYSLGPATFYGPKPCVRCMLTTIDPQTGRKGLEPIKTLATYRRVNNNIIFAANAIADHTSTGQVVRVGDAVCVIRRQKTWL
jgi:uncharacterized protein